MSDQLRLEDLYEPVAALTKTRTDDPSTARRAAFEALPRQGVQRRRILDAIAAAPAGLTYEDAADVLDMRGVSVSTRISELATGGWVESTSERKTTAGVLAKVWTVTDEAKAALG